MSLFLLSLFLLLVSSVHVARCIGRDRASVFWLASLMASLQIAALANVLSALRALAPAAWMAGQVILTGWLLAGCRLIQAPSPATRHREPEQGEDRLIGYTSLLLTAVILVISFGIILRNPISGVDETMYHASRVAHAIQEKTLFFSRTHNERQVSFPFGSELWLLWPMLLTRQEAVARVVFWVAFPLALTGLWLVIRRLGAPRHAAALGVCAWAATPLIFRNSLVQKPELWLVFCTLGAAWAFLPESSGEGEGCRRHTRRFLACGAWIGLAASIRIPALLLIPAAMIGCLVQLRPGWRSVSRGLVMLFAGLLATLIISGFAGLLLRNRAERGGLFGTPQLTALMTARKPVSGFPVHLGRFQLDLLDFPVAPGGGEWFTAHVQSVARLAGISARLPGEGGGWPGEYAPYVPNRAMRLGILGLFWTPLLLWLAGTGIRHWAGRKRNPAGDSDGQRLLGVASACMTGGTLALLLWQRHMLRFLLAPFTLATAAGISLLGRHRRLTRVFAAVVFLQGGVLLWGDVGLGRWRAFTMQADLSHLKEVDEKIPPEAAMLLVANQGCRDYLFYAPRHGLTRTVIPWGNETATPARFEEMVNARGVDWIFFESDGLLARHWLPDYDPRPLLEIIRTSGGWQEVPLTQPGQRLFRRITESR